MCCYQLSVFKKKFFFLNQNDCFTKHGFIHSYKSPRLDQFKNNWKYNIPKIKNVTRLNITMKIVYKKSLYKHHTSLNNYKSNMILFGYLSYKIHI